MSAEERIISLTAEVKELRDRRAGRVRGGSAYKRLTHKLNNKEKDLSYLRRCVKRQTERANQERIQKLMGGTNG